MNSLLEEYVQFCFGSTQQVKKGFVLHIPRVEKDAKKNVSCYLLFKTETKEFQL